MHILRRIGLLMIGAALFTPAIHARPAQVSVNIGIGAEPVCPYGYYEVPPYDCAPDGYYGPEWYTGGVFLGAGPWFHGPRGFHGHVDHHFDYRHGYHGPYPHRGEHSGGNRREFHGRSRHDSHGHEVHRWQH
jgi:hypothetical protein